MNKKIKVFIVDKIIKELILNIFPNKIFIILDYYITRKKNA